MKHAITLIILVGLIGIGCVNKTTLEDTPEPKKISSSSETGIEGEPLFSTERVPKSTPEKSPLQLSAYQAARKKVNINGNFVGGACIGFPYPIGTHLVNSKPSQASVMSVPDDSLYVFKQYYAREVKRIRSTYAWAGWSLRAITIAAFVIYLVSQLPWNVGMLYGI